MPSLIDPTLAPDGKHVIHAYVPATEPYEWVRLYNITLSLFHISHFQFTYIFHDKYVYLNVCI